jgi:hypothetical protein
MHECEELNKTYDCYFPSKLIFNLTLLDGLRGFIADDGEKLLDTHGSVASGLNFECLCLCVVISAINSSDFGLGGVLWREIFDLEFV